MAKRTNKTATTTITEMAMPIIRTIDYRPTIKAAVETIVGIATRSKERADSKAGKIRAYFKMAKDSNIEMDQVLGYLMETYGFNRSRAKAYVKCFW